MYSVRVVQPGKTSKAAAKVAAGHRGLAGLARPRPLPGLYASCRIARPPHPWRTARPQRRPKALLLPSIYRHCRNNAYNQKNRDFTAITFHSAFTARCLPLPAGCAPGKHSHQVRSGVERFGLRPKMRHEHGIPNPFVPKILMNCIALARFVHPNPTVPRESPDLLLFGKGPRWSDVVKRISLTSKPCIG